MVYSQQEVGHFVLNCYFSAISMLEFQLVLTTLCIARLAWNFTRLWGVASEGTTPRLVSSPRDMAQ